MPAQVRFVECSAAGDSADLDALLALHRRWFPTHDHVQAELVDNAHQPPHRGHLVVHQVLAPAGFIVVHTNLRRRVGVIHFLAVDEEFRPVTVDGRRLALALVDHAVNLVTRDGVEFVDGNIVGVVAESEDDLVRVWASWGFDALPIDYAEPYFGMHWPDHGDPTFFAMTLVGLVLPQGSNGGENPTSLGQAGAAAFLLDHYVLPPDHPRVTTALTNDH